MIIVSNVENNNRSVTSQGVNYQTTLNGNLREVEQMSYALIGQAHTPGNNRYHVRQYFAEFDYELPLGQLPVAGHFFLRNSNSYGTSINRNLEVRRFDWGSSVPDVNSFRNPSQLTASHLEAISYDVGRFSDNTLMYLGFRTIYGAIGESGVKRYVMSTSRNRLGNTPATGSREDMNVSTGSSSVANRPRFVVGATTENMLHPVLAAQVQLTDGSWVMAEKTDMDREQFQMQLRRVRTDGTSHVIWGPTTPEDVRFIDNLRGSHAVAITRDDSDNVYLCDSGFDTVGSLNLRVAVKSGGETWAMTPTRTFSVPDDDNSSNIQAVQMVWHNLGSGRLVIVSFRDWGRQGGTQEAYSLLDSSRVISGAGNMVLSQGRGGERGFSAYPANLGRWNPLNSTGALFDMHVDTHTQHSGYVLTAERHAALGSNASLSVGRYRIHSNFNQFTSSTFAWLDNGGGWATYDPDAKCRILSTGQAHTFVKISVDAREERGLTIDSLTVSDGSNNTHSRNNYASYDDPSFNVPSMPEGPDLATEMTWDAVYFPPDNSVWIYYLDDNNPRRLMRTAFRMGTNQAQQNEVEVVAELAPSGHTIHAIRVQRNKVVSDQVLITAASEDGSGNHEYQYHIDRINVAPTQPTLVPIANYDSEDDQDLTWIFNDANFDDVQSAYQLEILRVSDSTVVVDTGKVTSADSVHEVVGNTIDNNYDYMWRVRVWDSADASSAWSDYSTFATSNTGIVTIVDPAMDNDPDIFTNDYLIQWEIAGASQDEYRVILTRTEDDSVFYDTGWVGSTNREHMVPVIESDVEYMVTVRARMSLVESAPGYRLLTTHYVTVEQPIVSLQVHTEYIMVSVDNPEPRGDRPTPTVNRVYRRQFGEEGPFQYVGECEPNESFRDYTVASSTVYEYKVRAGVEE